VNRIYGAYGAFVKVRLSNPRPQPIVLHGGITALPGAVEVDALIDPSAPTTSVEPDLIRFPLGLDLAPAGNAEAAPRWEVDLATSGSVCFPSLLVADGSGGLDFVDARRRLGRAGGATPTFHVILGRDVLRRAALEVEGRGAFGMSML
jgi:hypothetical protein